MPDFAEIHRPAAKLKQLEYPLRRSILSKKKTPKNSGKREEEKVSGLNREGEASADYDVSDKPYPKGSSAPPRAGSGESVYPRAGEPGEPIAGELVGPRTSAPVTSGTNDRGN